VDGGAVNGRDSSFKESKQRLGEGPGGREREKKTGGESKQRTAKIKNNGRDEKGKKRRGQGT